MLKIADVEMLHLLDLVSSLECTRLQLEMLALIGVYTVNDEFVTLFCITTKSSLVPRRFFTIRRKNTSGDPPIPFWFWCARMLAHCSILI